MGAVTCRNLVAVTLGLFVPFATGAAPLRASDLDMCHAQRQIDCRRVSLAELDRLRGGMVLMTSIGPIEVTFGVTQAVYINNKLVAVTQLVMTPAVNSSRPNLPEAQAASSALQSALGAPQSSFSPTGAGASGGSAPEAAKGATSSAITTASQSSGAPAQTAGLNGTLSAVPNHAGTSGQATSVPTASPTSMAATQTPGLNSTLNAVPNSASAPAQTTPASSSQAAANSSSTGAIGSASPTVSVNGSVVTPGNPIINVPGASGAQVVVVQNGPGNIVVPSAADIARGVATIVQNTANNQAIRAVTEMNVSIALSKSMSAASISNAVRQGMITSRP